uniref:protein phosphatase 1 regulatory subunit 15B isoform X2 n=1 Tax=Pristiophorus japonicus TaxID=55135 RepID=UPI00398E8C61
MNWDRFPHSRAAGCGSDGGQVREPQVRPVLYPSPWTRLLSAVCRPSLLVLSQRAETAGPAPRPLMDQMPWGSWGRAWASEAQAGLLAWAGGLLGKLYPGRLEATSRRGITSLGERLQQQQQHQQWSGRPYPPALSPAWPKPGLSSMQAPTCPAALAHPATQSAAEKPAELPRCPTEPTPDQDYGYSSLEEEHAGSKRRVPPPELGPDRSPGADPPDQTVTKLDRSDTSMGDDDEWDVDESSDDETEGHSDQEGSCHPLPRPQCSNRTIAYILGNNSSSSDDDDDSEDIDWDDDGFDSDGSSEFSDADETEKLWNSLAGTSDPYNLMNFQACIKTQQKLDTRTAFESSCPQQTMSCSLVLEDDEDRMDSGFSDAVQGELQKTFTQLVSERKCCKKVAFDEHVTEYYVSSDEIRKGPWEEYARDRFRFQKRIRETEEDIGYCFTFEHRWTVLQRMRLGS